MSDSAPIPSSAGHLDLSGLPPPEVGEWLKLADPQTVQLLGWATFLILALGIFMCAGLVAAGVSGRLRWRERIVGLRAPFPERDALAYVLLLLLLNGLFTLVLALVAGDRTWSNEVALLVLHSAAFHGGALLLAVAWMKIRGLTPHALFGLDPNRRLARDMLWGALLFFAVMPAIFGASALWQGLLRHLGISTDLQDILLTITSRQPWPVQLYLLFLAVVLAPIAEEILFRGILLRGLQRRFGASAAVFLTSVLFALIHMHLPALAPIFVLSIGLCLACLYTRSLLIPILMHALFNAFSLAIMLILRG
jgi:membrane protease YdiL (CAAX protease family)